MLEVKFYDTVDDSLLKFAVIISLSNGKWVFCKHKERDTYEAPGGHREVGEDILETAKRELQEETGAIRFDIKPICVYSVTGKNSVNETGEETFGLLCFAEIREFSGELHCEMEKVELMDELPENWTYPLIQPKLIEKYLQIEKQSYSRIQLAAKQTIEYIKKIIKPGMNLLEIRKLCEEKLLELGADSFWYWDVGAFVFAGDETTVSVSGKEITDIDAATVHKFQGKEKENIIISTVDDEISDFADDPYLINVAVSRAKKKLMLVVTGNEQSRERNITELIDYIQYNNFEVTESKIYSIFDYLYKQYTEERRVYLQKHKKVSEYDSENLMYSLIEDIISDNKYSSLDVVCHFPLNMLIKNPELLNEQECQYAMNPATHLDFLIYNRIGKKPVLAIEVDGYEYHKEDTVQASRDLLKNHIMELYEIPLLRFMTNGSGEREKIVEMLDKFV